MTLICMTQNQGQTTLFFKSISSKQMSWMDLLSLSHLLSAILSLQLLQFVLGGIISLRWEGSLNDIFSPRVLTGVGCLFVVGGVRVLLWIWLWELSWSAVVISAGLWSNATSSKSTLISAALVYRLHRKNTAEGCFWEVWGIDTDLL